MLNNPLIVGRKAEQESLHEFFQSPRSEFVAIYGRRRVGKTFLVRETFRDAFTFYASGVLEGTTSEQLASFNRELTETGGKPSSAKNWQEAFENLYKLIDASSEQSKKIIFLDEIPWMSTAKSGFLSALDYFWNRRISLRTDVLLLICGSAASWMIDNVVDNTGGLHNRLTGSIYLRPFNLKECEDYFRAKAIDIPRYQIAEAYMIFGGIPYYLDFFKPKFSLAQNVDAIYFEENAPLRNEYKNLYRSLFKNAEGHVKVVEALAAKSAGKTRAEISASSGVLEGGGLTKLLNELTNSGFVRTYLSFGKKKRDRMYQLIDPFTLFCLRFEEKRQAYSTDYWLRFCTTSQHAAWAGYSFEMLCLSHVPQIRRELGIAGVLTGIYAWRSREHQPGAQIDLVIDRADGLINLCEIKYASSEFVIDKAYDQALRNKRAAFMQETGTRKGAQTTMITTYGLKKNAYQAGIPFALTLDDLF